MSRTNYFILSVIFLVANVVFAGESPYNPNPSPRYLFCQLHDAETRTTYYSGIFLINQKDIYPIQDAYLHFVAKKYSYKIQPGVDQYHMPVECVGQLNSNAAKSLKDGRAKDEQQRAFKVTDTEWTFGSAKAVEEPTTSSNNSSSSNGSTTQDDKLDSFTEATLRQDPRGLNLSPLDRQFVLSEAPKAKSYCAKDPELSKALDCTCFVRTVFNYRIARVSGPIQQTNFPPLDSILTKPDFSCSECVNKNQSTHVSCDRGNNPH